MATLKSLVPVFLLLVFFNGGMIPSDARVHPACDRLTITYSISKPAGQSLSSVTIKAEDGRAPYTFVLLNKEGYPVNLDFKRNEFEKLKAGTYRCIVVDSEDCKKEVTIDII